MILSSIVTVSGITSGHNIVLTKKKKKRVVYTGGYCFGDCGNIFHKLGPRFRLHLPFLNFECDLDSSRIINLILRYFPLQEKVNSFAIHFHPCFNLT